MLHDRASARRLYIQSNVQVVSLSLGRIVGCMLYTCKSVRLAEFSG